MIYARSPGAPRGEPNGNYRHGYYTTEARMDRAWHRVMLKAPLFPDGLDELFGREGEP